MLDRVKNSSNNKFFVLYICQKYIEKEWRPPAAAAYIYKTKGIKWTSWIKKATDLPLRFLLVPENGIEPLTSHLWGERSYLLSYTGIYKTPTLQNTGIEPATFNSKN